MKALLCERNGPVSGLTLRDIADPVAGPGEVVVAVAACGINFPDALIVEGKYQIKPEFPFSPGGEIAGTIASVGPDVVGWQPGDHVMAFTIWGGLREKMVVPATDLLRRPAAMPPEDAAALLIAYGTALYALDNLAHLAAGENVLVLGGAGGVGTASIQIAKATGARVVAAVSSETKATFCRNMGADDVVVYDASDAALKDVFKQAAGPSGFDVIIDPVGGAFSEAALRSIAWGGRHMVVGFATGTIPKMPLNLTLLKGCSVVGVYLGGFLKRYTPERERMLDRLNEMCLMGVRPHIEATCPLADAATAIQLLADRKATGKFVVTMA